MPWVAPIGIGVIAVCMDASLGRCWQVVAVAFRPGSAWWFAAGRWCGAGGDDRRDVGVAESQVFADEGAGD
jgi:hypothetical protein